MAGLELVVGTYEEFTVCYRTEPFPKDPNKLYLKESFAAHLHTGSVRSIASHGKYVATGGADDRVCLLNVKDGTKLNEFLHHEGTVNSIAFSHDGSFMFTGGSDGTMTAINMAKQTVEKTWKGAHKTTVQSISIHPQNKMALSLGGDMVLKTWDLVTGRALFTTALNKDNKYGRSLTDVQWSPDGEHFALLGDQVVDVISIETTRSVRTLRCESKPTVMSWLSPEEIAVGLESGTLLLANINTENQQEKLQIYESRLKALSCFGDYIATASSAGDISLWHLQDRDFNEICTHNIGCRPICLTLMNSGKYEALTAKPNETVVDKEALLRENQLETKRLNNAIAMKVERSRAWVSVETEDPVQQAASKRSIKSANRKRALIARRKDGCKQGTVGEKRSKGFIEESISDTLTLSSPSSEKKAKKVNNGKGQLKIKTKKKIVKP